MKIKKKRIYLGINAEICGFIQSKCHEYDFMGYPVFCPDSISVEYDYIFVANTFSDEIKANCLSNRINLEKVIFLYKGKDTEWKISNEIKTILGESNYTRYCAEYGRIEESFFINDRIKYDLKNTRESFRTNDEYLWPIISDKYEMAGFINNYFWQDLWAAKLIIQSGTKKHFDIGSRLDGFIAHLLSANIDVSIIDIREFPMQLEGLHAIVDDATTLNQIPDNSIDSMSALCSLEHFGLGRYGDPIDPEACFKCFENIQRKITDGGNLYISVPVGKERVEYNAHRIFYPKTIVDSFNKMKLIEFSVATIEGIEKKPDIHKFDDDPHNGEYRYGLFHFMK